MTDEFYTDENRFFPGVRPVARNLLEAVFYDAPLTAAAIADFGLESRDHYETLRYAIQVTDVHPAEIDAMTGDGATLTAWVNDTGYNRKGLVFRAERNGREQQTAELHEEPGPKRQPKHRQLEQER